MIYSLFKWFTRRNRRLTRESLKILSFKEIMDISSNADHMLAGVAQEILKEIPKRLSTFHLDIITSDKPGAHVCQTNYNDVVCEERDDGLWIKEYGTAIRSEGRTYKVNFCPWCGYKCKTGM